MRLLCAGSVLWRHPTLLYTKETLTSPLTTLNSEMLQNEATKLFKSIQLFISVPIAPSGIDYHVALTQHALQQCLAHPELQNELFCQLVKQTSRHPSPKMGVQFQQASLYKRISIINKRDATTLNLDWVQHLLLCATQSLFLCDEPPTPAGSGGSEDSKLNPPPFVFVQGWQLLALACSLFQPRSRTLWLLNTHLRKNAEPR
ncbi:PLEKHH2 [Cordylochernes scorpioides]|uniref:PLEKHH2 n=1 Tax=Cordylochernes scorpioides TaxID=51811 RepID=A0ABY6LQN5_9ARAC|nr:PLEKHH2 [Cordylochernes scorpioides]